MTLKQFTDATEMDKIKAIWRGKLVAERKDLEFTYRLFKIDDFFVEAKISPLLGFARDFKPLATRLEAMGPYMPPIPLNNTLF